MLRVAEMSQERKTFIRHSLVRGGFQVSDGCGDFRVSVENNLYEG